MKQAPETLREEVARLRNEIAELESHFASWPGDTVGGRKLRSLAERISLAAKRLKALVSENTHHP